MTETVQTIVVLDSGPNFRGQYTIFEAMKSAQEYFQECFHE